MRHVLILVLFLSFSWYGVKCKKPVPFKQLKPPPKYDNPGEIRDRKRDLQEKAFNKKDGKDAKTTTTTTEEPRNKTKHSVKKKGVFRPSVMGDGWKNRFRQPYHPAWMDYCDPYHCNDYHKVACGLNRATMRFKWFQSGCHIALNNVCNVYKGTLKYDIIEPKHCTKYVLNLRSACPRYCTDELAPLCGVSSYDNHVALFKNQCYFKKANCKMENLNEYDEVDMDICRNTLAYNKKLGE